MHDRRHPSATPSLSVHLVQRGRAQLDQEIGLIKLWLAELNETRKDNPESLAARKAYVDMLQSREDLLAALPKSHSTN